MQIQCHNVNQNNNMENVDFKIFSKHIPMNYTIPLFLEKGRGMNTFGT